VFVISEKVVASLQRDDTEYMVIAEREFQNRAGLPDVMPRALFAAPSTPDIMGIPEQPI
jgi:hypothetical protein